MKNASDKTNKPVRKITHEEETTPERLVVGSNTTSDEGPGRIK